MKTLMTLLLIISAVFSEAQQSRPLRVTPAEDLFSNQQPLDSSSGRRRRGRRIVIPMNTQTLRTNDFYCGVSVAGPENIYCSADRRSLESFLPNVQRCQGNPTNGALNCVLSIEGFGQTHVCTGREVRDCYLTQRGFGAVVRTDESFDASLRWMDYEYGDGERYNALMVGVRIR